jgi:hypothetical protein
MPSLCQLTLEERGSGRQYGGSINIAEADESGTSDMSTLE